MTKTNNLPRGQKPWEHVVALVALLGVVLMLLFSGCSPRIVERVDFRHDTTYVSRVDSLVMYEKDSVFVREKGDTVFQYVERIRYRDRWRVDTLLKIRVDYVAVDRVKEVQVEQPLSAWKRAKMGAFWWLLLALAASLAWIFRSPIKGLLKLL